MLHLNVYKMCELRGSCAVSFNELQRFDILIILELPLADPVTFRSPLVPPALIPDPLVILIILITGINNIFWWDC